MRSLSVVMAQLNPLVGDIEGNVDQCLRAIASAREQYQADVILFPELVLSGYPPEDLLLRPSIGIRIERALARLAAAVDDFHVVVGYPRRTAVGLFNSAGVLHRGELVAEYDKQCLPNYQVFDEKRYFAIGDQSCVLSMQGVPVGLSICEDIWEPGPVRAAAAAGAQLILNLNASPYHIDKQQEREAVVAARVAESGIPLLYVNMVGGQDELVFDGGSFAVATDGRVQARGPQYTEALVPVRLHWDGQRCTVAPGECAEPLPRLEAVYQALVLGTRDYIDKNGFPGVVLGLSGGIDSALTLAVAADALGPERVEAVMMPYRYTSTMSLEDAAEQARRMGVAYRVLPIEAAVTAFSQILQPVFEGQAADKTEENLQARCRGVLLMAMSNKSGRLVLTTGNKSELAVGYSTLYGDMAGGFDVLKDVPKSLVFELARWRNHAAEVIPERVITRPPSAELAPDQTDQDTLPNYAELDLILERYIERDESASAIIAAGFDAATVHRVIRMVDINEYKRRQAPIGVRITRRGFGRDRRYPVTSGWVIGD